tara:strand:+ start:321 stop:485 length:165 start_codon:yes stop_codon:yes gene_type:complete
MKQVKFKGGLKRRHNEGTLGGDSVPFKIHKRKKPKLKKPKTIWERFKEWLIGIT